MEKSDTYHTIDSVYEAVFKDKGSRFLAFAHPIETTEQVKSLLDKYRKDAQFKGACHFCYAFKLNEGNISRSNDDGEPSGTAGKPILNQIESAALNDILVIVVRFFGGTLLGTSGLINAYKLAAQECLKQVKAVEVVLRNELNLSFNYTLQNEIDRLLKGFNIIVANRNFTDKVYYQLLIKRNDEQSLRDTMSKLAFNNQIEIN